MTHSSTGEQGYWPIALKRERRSRSRTRRKKGRRRKRRRKVDEMRWETWRYISLWHYAEVIGELHALATLAPLSATGIHSMLNRSQSWSERYREK
jgi:hypothetical protein